jgi:hypothetical protein
LASEFKPSLLNVAPQPWESLSHAQSPGFEAAPRAEARFPAYVNCLIPEALSVLGLIEAARSIMRLSPSVLIRAGHSGHSARMVLSH